MTMVNSGLKGLNDVRHGKNTSLDNQMIVDVFNLGKSGSIVLGPTADREPIFWFWQLDDTSSEFYPYTVTEYDENKTMASNCC